MMYREYFTLSPLTDSAFVGCHLGDVPIVKGNLILPSSDVDKEGILLGGLLGVAANHVLPLGKRPKIHAQASVLPPIICFHSVNGLKYMHKHQRLKFTCNRRQMSLYFFARANH